VKYLQSFTEYLGESHIGDMGGERVVYFPGRFQPFHKGHLLAIEQAAQIFGVRVIPVQIIKPNTSSELADIYAQIRNSMTQTYPSWIADFLVSQSNYIPHVLEALHQRGFQPIGLVCGSDRTAAYQAQLNQIRNQGKIQSIPTSFAIQEVMQRQDNLSGNALRAALQKEDWATFASMTPENLHIYREALKKHLNYD
jgi:cytidyltransferase-like protein